MSIAPTFPNQGPTGDLLSTAMKHVRSALGTVLGFSLVINLLMLVAPIYMIQVYDRVLTSGKTETLLMLTLMAFVALLVMAALDAMRSTLTTRIGGWFNQELGPVFLSSGVRARLAGSRNGAQPLRDLNQVGSFISTQGMLAFFDAPWVPIFILVIFMLHPLLGLVAIITAVILLILSYINDLASRKPGHAVNAASFEAIQLAETTIRRGEEVQAMGFLNNLVGRWAAYNRSAVHALNRLGEANGMIVAMTKFVRSFAQIAILGVGAWLVLLHEVTPGTMIAASIMLGRALAPVEMALGTWRNFTTTRLAYDRLRSHLDEYPVPKDRMKLPRPTGHISVRDLHFTAPGSGVQILHKISFDLSPGEAVAVIGPSGTGKSTLCRLLLGLSKPDSGTIRLDGNSIGNWDSHQLGAHIGYLPQEVELFSGTVGENIARMAKMDETRVIEAAMLSNANELIQNLPDGYDTMVGEGGLRLSGGQRQRIGLARAVYGEPRLIVLDEPNANLDQAGEQALSDAIEKLKGIGATLVIVGHRPSTLAQANRIILVQEGTISLEGPRDEVLEKLSRQAPPANHNGNGQQMQQTT